MSKFNKKKKGDLPAVNTASLPDIVFMLLFFFMVATDEKLVKILKEKGYKIARRTVAKYREQLNIPVARLRKEI